MDSTNTSNWKTFATEAPELAEAVRRRFTWTKHHVLATLRRDGSPRVSGTEVQFHANGLYAGSMPGSLKAKDLINDPRFALHSNPGEPTMEGGDAKISGFAALITEADVLAGYIGDVTPPEPFHLFELRIAEVVRTSLHPDGDRLVIELWRPGQAIQRTDRY